MKSIRLCPAAEGKTIRYTCEELAQRGYEILPQPCREMTHLLLPCPSVSLSDEALTILLKEAAPSVTVIGGFLDRAPLASYRRLDLLQNPGYLARNAEITAQCTLSVAMPLLETVWPDTHVCVIGFGRIGSCLSRCLTALGALVTVCARSEAVRKTAAAYGCQAIDFPELPKALEAAELVCNTVPAFTAKITNPRQVAIDLASKPGLQGTSVLSARGLPGKLAPKSTGIAMAEAIWETVG